MSGNNLDGNFTYLQLKQGLINPQRNDSVQSDNSIIQKKAIFALKTENYTQEVDTHKNTKTQETSSVKETNSTDNVSKTKVKDSPETVPPKKDPRPPAKQDVNPPDKNMKPEHKKIIEKAIQTKLPKDTSYTTNAIIADGGTGHWEHPNRTRVLDGCTVTYTKDGDPCRVKLDDGTEYIVTASKNEKTGEIEWRSINFDENSTIFRSNGKLSSYTKQKKVGNNKIITVNRDGKGKLISYEVDTFFQDGTITRNDKRDRNGILESSTVMDSRTRGTKNADGSYSGSTEKVIYDKTLDAKIKEAKKNNKAED